jgi:hypothetical protein
MEYKRRSFYGFAAETSDLQQKWSFAMVSKLTNFFTFMVEEVIGYCVKCKAKQPMAEAVRVEMPAKGGGTRPAMKGKCPVCSTGMYKILPKS